MAVEEFAVLGMDLGRVAVLAEQPAHPIPDAQQHLVQHRAGGHVREHLVEPGIAGDGRREIADIQRRSGLVQASPERGLTVGG